MSNERHFESLYRILVGAEDLLSGSVTDPDGLGHASYEDRLVAMNEQAWESENEIQSPVGARPGVDPSSMARNFSSEWSRMSHGVPTEGGSGPEEPAAQLSREERQRRLDAIADQIGACQACPLSMGRINAVPGEGALDPLVMIVGEGPGYHEDQQGRPFVGKAGHYLDQWLEAIGITRAESAFIANIVKCRPPNNRDPKPEEIDVCSPYLRQQIALVKPQLIVTVGRISTRILTGSTQGITRIHGTFFRYEGIPLVPTFHPSAVLRNPAYRRPVWEDLKKVRNWLIDHAGHRPQGSEE